MGGRRLEVRIIGLAATIRGFAYAITEGPGCLVDVNTLRPGNAKKDVGRALATVLANSRPLFVAVTADKSKRGTREWLIDDALLDICGDRNAMILRVKRSQLARLTGGDATPIAIAHEISRRFPEVNYPIPRKRRAWESRTNAVGAFQAIALSVSAWQMFRPPPIDDS